MNTSRQTKIRSIVVLVAAALLLEVTTAVQYVSVRNGITEQINETAQRDLSATNHTADVKRITEEAIAGILPEVERLVELGDRDSLHRVLQQVVREHSEIVGVDFTFRVGEDGIRDGYYTFVDDKSGDIADTVIGFDFTERSWYREGLHGNGFWSEPYDSHYYEAFMSTYSHPVHNAKGEVVAVIGADIPMTELSAMATQLYENLQRSILPVILFQLFGLLVLGFIIYRSILSVRHLNEANAEKELVGRELGIASRIQQAMLPTEKLSDEYVEVVGNQVPAKQVGGDLYDYFVRDGKLFFSIGDVCGKGIPAAIFMSMTQAVFRSVASHEDDPARIVRSMNVQASKGNTTGMFVTLFVGVLDLSTGQLRYSNAGHEHPLIISNGEVRTLEAKSHLPIGVMEETRYQDQETQIAPGDMVMLFTDGLTEAMNVESALFGKERVVQAVRGESPQQLLDNMSQAVAGFVRGAEQSDDLTMLAIHFKKKA
jgi:hypothetical protein